MNNDQGVVDALREIAQELRLIREALEAQDYEGDEDEEEEGDEEYEEEEE